MRKLVGAHRQHVPLHPGFPTQVMTLTEAQLYLNAVSHYVSLRRLPATEDQRPPLLHNRSPRVVELGSAEDFETVCNFSQFRHARVPGQRCRTEARLLTARSAQPPTPVGGGAPQRCDPP